MCDKPILCEKEGGKGVKRRVERRVGRSGGDKSRIKLREKDIVKSKEKETDLTYGRE